jgi:hypothetical protein
MKKSDYIGTLATTALNYVAAKVVRKAKADSSLIHLFTSAIRNGRTS